MIHYPTGRSVRIATRSPIRGRSSTRRLSTSKIGQWPMDHPKESRLDARKKELFSRRVGDSRQKCALAYPLAAPGPIDIPWSHWGNFSRSTRACVRLSPLYPFWKCVPSSAGIRLASLGRISYSIRRNSVRRWKSPVVFGGTRNPLGSPVYNFPFGLLRGEGELGILPIAVLRCAPRCDLS